MHAFLIVGPSKSERKKKTGTLLSSRKVDNSPLVRKMLAPDQLLEEKETYGIEDIRVLTTWMSLVHQKPAAVVIEEAERLTIPAQNALLKNLEEGAPNVIIVLSAESEKALLPTIISRCQVVRIISKEGELSLEESQKIVVWLTKVSAQEPEKRILLLYQALSKISGKSLNPHVGAIRREDAKKFLERIIEGLQAYLTDASGPRPPELRSGAAGGDSEKKRAAGPVDILKLAVTAHRELQQNLNISLVLQQFMLDLPAT